MKIDPYNHQEKYTKWLEENRLRIKGISSQNSDIILRYLFDIERGINISASNVRGSRSYARLNSLKLRVVTFAKKFEGLYDLEDIPQLKEKMSNFSYRIIYYRTIKEFLKEIKKFSPRDVIPLLLWINKET
ncbi:hypothetical protein A3K73_03765 [Candidatus Pacearchaeota archaeon RBG_13_36_9]|nr:MAG: hypothetical protein A3K73_03765 [Candidatus Pacearchaeota archaeon RBG_13_36_9]